YVVVGDGGRIMSSTDGKTWTNRSVQISNNFYGVTHGHEGFVAVGQSGVIYTSETGTSNWTPRASGTTNHLYAVAAGEEEYVAVGNLGSTCLWSADGVTWQTRSLPISGTIQGVAADGEGNYVIAYTSGNVALSTNKGVSWTDVTPTDISVTSYYAVSYGLDNFVIVGSMNSFSTS